MTAELLKLLESLIVSGAVGVLNLGSGARARRVFFTGNELHLLEPGRECRFIPIPALLESEHISTDVIEEMTLRLNAGPGALSQMLAERGLLSPEERQVLGHDERVEEVLLILERAGRFIFEEGNVPEEVLLPSALTVGVSLEELANALRDRLREQLEIDRTIPTVTEVPVVSSCGREILEAGDHWVFRQVGTLVDGHRTLRDLMKESPYFPHLTRQVLAAAIRQRWLKKTQFTELLELNPFDFSPCQAGEVMNQLEEAIETADDQLPLRRTLSLFSLRAGRVEKAVAELTTIGQFLHERGDTSGAVSGYREALRWEPNAPVARDNLVRLYTEAADRAHHADCLE